MGSMKKGQKFRFAEQKFSLWLVAAAAMHLLLLFSAIYLQILDSGRHETQKIVSVALVTLPGSGASQESSAKKGGTEALSAPMHEIPHPPAKKKSVKVKVAEPKELPVSQKKVVIEPVKPKAKTKPKVVEKPPDITKALERLKQTVDKKTATQPQPSTGNINKALAQLQQKVKSEGEGAGAGSGRGSSSTGRNGAGKGYGSGGTAAPYKAEIASIIMQNWEFSKLLLKNSYGMEVYVRINILPNGIIKQIVFDRRAPSEYLNNSVKRALEKSSPLPLLPKEEGTRDVWIGFVFTPEGIEK